MDLAQFNASCDIELYASPLPARFQFAHRFTQILSEIFSVWAVPLKIEHRRPELQQTGTDRHTLIGISPSPSNDYFKQIAALHAHLGLPNSSSVIPMRLASPQCPASALSSSRGARLDMRCLASSGRTVGSRRRSSDAVVLKREQNFGQLPGDITNDGRRRNSESDDGMRAAFPLSSFTSPALDGLEGWWSSIPSRSKLVFACGSAFCLSNMDKVNMTVAGKWATGTIPTAYPPTCWRLG